MMIGATNNNSVVDVRRGCQPPWYSFSDSPIPVCQNITEMRKMFEKTRGLELRNDDKVFSSPMVMARRTGCPLPCRITKIT